MKAKALSKGRVYACLPLALMLVSGIAAAASYQARTFDPTVYKFYGGLNPNTWGFTNAMCGIQLPANADCWGNFVAYVLQTTPGASTICATLLSAKMQGTTVTYQLDITNAGQCEIARVEM
jgi:hypothetical protein